MRAPVDREHAPGCQSPVTTEHELRAHRLATAQMRTEPSPRAQRISSALDELAAFGSDVCTLLNAVNKGATLQLGPSTTVGSIGGRLVHGSRKLNATGDIRTVLADLAAGWK